jgi:hypothetical protein
LRRTAPVGSIASTNESFCAGKGEKKQYENNLRFVGDFATVRTAVAVGFARVQ